ncbi:DUF4907 domain-containing protein [Mucilaginibacter calamicampi]|uniref:DUF4907 domain-containing protein n=1 Tax=Mucilaginibacter calamicampi TaxID=1302352 RepID=A0ABW2Z547_9SPHI
MKTYYFLFACSLSSLLGSCQSRESGNDQLSRYTAKIYLVDSTGYGYDIYLDTKMIIHQPMIPGVLGRSGFRTRANAQDVANLIISKLEKAIMPPSVSQRELDSLNIEL